MQRLAFPLIGLIVFGGVALALTVPASASNLPEQSSISSSSLQPSAATHETRARLQDLVEFRNRNEIIPPIEAVSSAPPRRSSFMATWQSVSGAKGYFLDVSTDNSFSNYVDGYHDLDVGNVNGRAVTGLNPGTIYYYRVRPYTAAGSGGYSNVTTATTDAPAGLIIHPTFDSSVPPAMRDMIEGEIIPIYESLFSDQITPPIQILFRYSNAPPRPTASPGPFPPGVLSASLSVLYDIPWNDFISALRADATTSNDNRANASLPGSALSPNIAPSSANGRAVRLNTPPAMFADGHIGPGGPYDGIVTLNSAAPFWFSRPLISGSFDAQRATEHEIDEVMGLGSALTPCPPQSSYEAESSDNTITGGAGIASCPTCSGGEKVVYVGNNAGILTFNDVTVNATHSYVVTIYYTNGDPVRYALLSVNSRAATPVTFPSTGSFQTVGSVQRTVTLNADTNNTLTFSNPVVGSWAPDFDRIVVNCATAPPTNLRPQDLFSWSSPGARNLTANGSRYFSIDSGNTDIVGFNQNPAFDFGDWLSEACPQHHPFVQNAFACPDQISDISATSPEGINLDVIGYDLVNAPPPTPTPAGAPGVTTDPATNVASFSATLNGGVNPHGLATTVYFQYGITTSYGLTSTPQTKTGNTYQAIAANISSLSASTTYHFRTVATNSAGTTYGTDRTFTTLSATGPPLVTTTPASLIASYSARLNGSVDPHGLSTTVYFQYGTTTSYGLTSSAQSKSGNAYQSVAAGISGLNASTTYHFRIVATNSAGTTYGTDQTFSTLSATGPPVVVANPATNVTSSSATLNAAVNPHGLTTSVHFQYGTTTSYSSTTPSQTKTENMYQTASANISGLSASTTYHFRVVATNSAGTSYGSDTIFTTP